jgi:hypothetical protein
VTLRPGIRSRVRRLPGSAKANTLGPSVTLLKTQENYRRRPGMSSTTFSFSSGKPQTHVRLWLACLESGNEDINGPDACALVLDLYVDNVIREQAARIERIYTGKASTERLEGQTDLSEDGAGGVLRE